jgi:hypothetical protein
VHYLLLLLREPKSADFRHGCRFRVFAPHDFGVRRHGRLPPQVPLGRGPGRRRFDLRRGGHLRRFFGFFAVRLCTRVRLLVFCLFSFFFVRVKMNHAHQQGQSGQEKNREVGGTKFLTLSVCILFCLAHPGQSAGGRRPRTRLFLFGFRVLVGLLRLARLQPHREARAEKLGERDFEACWFI